MGSGRKPRFRCNFMEIGFDNCLEIPFSQKTHGEFAFNKKEAEALLSDVLLTLRAP